MEFLRGVQSGLIQVEGADAAGVPAVDVRSRAAIRGQAHVGMAQHVVLVVTDGTLAANKKKRVAVVQHTHFIRCQQLAAHKLPVGGIVSLPALGLTVGVGVNGFLAQELGNVLVGALLVAAQIDELIAVADDALPLLFEQGLQLGHVLNDDAHGDFPGTHGRQQLVKFIGQGDVGELVHDEVDVDWEPSAVPVVGRVVELLEELGVEHSDQEIKGAVVVGDDREDRGFAFPHQRQLQFVVLGDGCQGFQVELLQTGDQRDLDGFQGLAAAGMIALVILQRDVLRVPKLQPLEENVQRRHVLVVVLLHAAAADHVHDHGEVLLVGRGLIVQVEDQGQEQHGRRLVPEGVLRLGALGRRIFEQVRHQPLNIVVVPQIDEGIVAVAFLHVDQIDDLDLVPLRLQQASRVAQKLALRVQNYKRRICVHDIRFGIEPGFARAGAAADQHVEVSAVAASVQPDGDVLREDLVPQSVLIRVLFQKSKRVAPLGGAVFLASAIVALRREIDHEKKPVDAKKGEDSFWTVLAPMDRKRMFKYGTDVAEKTRKPVGQRRRNEQSDPDDRYSSQTVEDDPLPGELTSHPDPPFAFSGQVLE